MLSKKFINIAYSLILLAIWTSIVLFLSAKEEATPGIIISPLYFWTKLTNLTAGFLALLLIGLRIFRFINKNTNLLYSFLGITNAVLGICGLSLYFFHKINIIGLRDLLPNLVIGFAIVIDIFLF